VSCAPESVAKRRNENDSGQRLQFTPGRPVQTHIVEARRMRFNVALHVKPQWTNEQPGILGDSTSDDDWPNEDRLARRNRRREMFGRQTQTKISGHDSRNHADRCEDRGAWPSREENDQPNEEKNEPDLLAQG